MPKDTEGYVDNDENTAIARELQDTVIALRHSISNSIMTSPYMAPQLIRKMLEIDEKLIGPLGRVLDGNDLGPGVKYMDIKISTVNLKDYFVNHGLFGPHNYTYRQFNAALEKANDSNSFWDWMAQHQKKTTIISK